MRESLGLSVEEFAAALGLKDGRDVRALEVGRRHGKAFQLRGTGLQVLRYYRGIRAIIHALECGHIDDFDEAAAMLRDLLPQGAKP